MLSVAMPLHWNCEDISNNMAQSQQIKSAFKTNMSHFSYACKTEGENGISRLISETA